MEKNIIFKSVVYRFLERTFYQGVVFLVQIILLRLLTPHDFCIIAILMIFTSISQVFVQSGLNTALIQRKGVELEDFNSVFSLSLLISVILYFGLFISSSFIEEFYNMSGLKEALQLLALILIPNSLISVQEAKLINKMDFKSIFFSSFISVIISGVLGIILAINGFGIYSLIIQQLSNRLLYCFVLTRNSKWIPRLTISVRRIKILWSFGWKLLISSLIDTLYNNIQGLVIGKKFNSNDLAYYNQGKLFPQLLIDNINGSIQSVLLPTLSAFQDDKIKLKIAMRKSIRISCYVVFPLMAGLITIASPLISFILTDKWIQSVPYIQVFGLIFALWPIHTTNLQALNAQGRSDIYLKLEIIKKCIGVFILIFTIIYYRTPIAIVMGSLISSIISCFINIYPNKRLLDYGFIEQIKDVSAPLLYSVIMVVVILPIGYFQINDFNKLFIQVSIGIFVYIAISVFTKNESFHDLLGLIKGLSFKSEMRRDENE